MKKLVIILGMVSACLHAQDPLQAIDTTVPVVNTEKPKDSKWQRVLRPPFKTIAAMTDVTSFVSAIAALIYGADVLVGTDRLAKDRFMAALCCLFFSHTCNIFSRAVLEELNSNR